MKTVTATTGLIALATGGSVAAQALESEVGEAGLAAEPAIGQDALPEDAVADSLGAVGEPLVALTEWAYDPLFAEG